MFLSPIRFEEYWQEEVDKKGVEKASVTKAIFKMIRFRFALTTLMSILLNILSVLRSVRIIIRVSFLSST